MMKFLLVMISCFFIVNKISKFFYQIFFENLMFIILFMLLFIYPFSNLNNFMFIYNFLGMDFYSLGLLLLTFWIMSLMMMVSNGCYYKLNSTMFSFLMNLMLMMLFLCFVSMNLMMFYIFFESSLIPIFMMIMGWGYQLERIEASYYLMIYTLLGSMPLFLMIIKLYLMNGGLMLNILKIEYFSGLIYLSLIMAFLIKMPMYFVHMWLPKAHVEAPIMGSMILAGVMLKLGSYGLMRIMLLMLNLSIKLNWVFVIFGVMGAFLSSFICMFQVDMKLLVAYSSVVHMGVLMAGLMTMMSWGYLGGYLMMLSHGLCSSGLFCLVNINYERTKSRSLVINKGMINIFPSLSFLWFLLCSSNLSFPPSLNLFSEILMINSLIIWSKSMIFILCLVLFFSASYSLYLYSYSQHGKLGDTNNLFMIPTLKEYLLLILHWMPLNMLFLILLIFP